MENIFKVGDTFQLGNSYNKIYHEDCIKTMSKMPNDYVDVVFTSPPYNRKRNDKYKSFDDNNVNYYDFLINFIDESIRISKGNVYVNIMKNYYNKIDVFKLIGNYSEQIFDIFIWEKSNPLPASGYSITNSYEFIICFGDKCKSNKTYTKNHLTTSVAKMIKEHKAIMHEDVAKFFILNLTKPNDLVYDPFMGVGTTAKVCMNNNRNFIGSEITLEYCNIANDKLNSCLNELGNKKQ